MEIEEAVGQRLLLAFDGKERPSSEILSAIEELRPAGVTLYRALNVSNPDQVGELTRALQAAARAAGLPPLIIAADQEGGQLMAIGEGVTQLPGNLALGAAGSCDLARRAGRVLGLELRAMGVNVAYAPCCDVNINPENPVVGTRSFGEDPQMVAELAAAMIEGIQSAGVAATAKHFPGHGDTASDTHHGVAVIPHPLSRLRQVELPPFEAAIRSGVKLVMSSHIALPALDGGNNLPATLSRKVLTGLLREELGFSGVSVTDALNMRAIPQGETFPEEVLLAAQAGADLLLLDSNMERNRRVHAQLVEAARSGLLDQVELEEAFRRILALKNWLADQPDKPEMDLINSDGNQAVAEEIARRSITLIRNNQGLVPLRLETGQRLAVILPQPQDLTPADTSSYISPKLAAELGRLHWPVEEYQVAFAPTDAEINAVSGQIRGAAVVVLGTLNAFAEPAQVKLAQALLETGIPLLVAALRMPYDLMKFPSVQTYLCTYSIQEPSMRAMAEILFGQLTPSGSLPVSIPGMYEIGYRER